MIGKRSKKNKNKILVLPYHPGTRFAEQYRIISTNIQAALEHGQIRSIVVTSASAGEGKTTAVANLGAVMANQGMNVLLIDADFRKPSLHQFFDKENFNGLTNFIINNYTIEEVVTSTEVIGLSIMPSGICPQHYSELLSFKKMSLLLEKAKETYDLVLIDSPPIVENADSLILSNLSDASLLVMKSGKTKKDKVLAARNSLIKSKAALLGAIFNENKGRISVLS